MASRSQKVLGRQVGAPRVLEPVLRAEPEAARAEPEVAPRVEPAAVVRVEPVAVPLAEPVAAVGKRAAAAAVVGEVGRSPHKPRAVRPTKGRPLEAHPMTEPTKISCRD